MSLSSQIDTMVLGTPESNVSFHISGGEVTKQVSRIIIRKTPIMWGIPCDEVMFSKFFTQFNKNAGVMPWDAFGISESTYLPQARNSIHNGFLESKMEYLAMVDSDVLFPPYTFNKFIAYNLPVVAGWYKNKKDVHHPIVYDFVKDTGHEFHWKHRDNPGEGVEKVDGVGTGCMLMSRHVAEILGKNPYDMQKSGEDLVMCRKLMMADIPLHVDWDAACAHLGIQWV